MIKYVSIEEVLGNILLELPTPPTSQDLIKIQRFINRACKLLSVHKSLLHKKLTINIHKNKGELPADIVELVSVWHDKNDSGTLYRLREGYSDCDYLRDNEYSLQGNSIFVGDSNIATIGIKYTEPQIDCNGFWMIPDNEALKEAITYYVEMKLAKIGYPGLKIGFGDANQLFEKVWAPRAIEELKRFTPEDARALQDSTTKLIWDYDRWQMFGESSKELFI